MTILRHSPQTHSHRAIKRELGHIKTEREYKRKKALSNLFKRAAEIRSMIDDLCRA